MTSELKESSVPDEIPPVVVTSTLPPIVLLQSTPNITPKTSPSSSSSAVDQPVTIYYTFGKITASDHIAPGSISLPIDHWSLIGNMLPQQASVRTASTGVIDLDKESRACWTQPVHWIRAIRLSNDCHSYNIQLKFRPQTKNIGGSGTLPKLYLEAVKRIAAGDELQLWFSEEILALLQVTFLKPANIQGEKKYVCTRCLDQFETPNPLKLHITLWCGKRPISYLWHRLANIMKEFDTLKNIYTAMNGFDFQLNLNLEARSQQKNVLDLSVAGQHQQQQQLQQSHENIGKELFKPYYQPLSAFKPFKRDKSMTSEEKNTNIIEQLPNGSWTVHLNNLNNVTPSSPVTNAQLPFNEHAELESLASNLGKQGKQGHICLYCGKCYSRKYGLKIHIRTHTGYKPLKCKFCDRPFGDPSNLNKHVRLHAEGNTPYKCDLCGKILVRRRDLERHLKSRHIIDGELNDPDELTPSVTTQGDNSKNSMENLDGTSRIVEINNSVESDHSKECQIVEIIKADDESSISS